VLICELLSVIEQQFLTFTYITEGQEFNSMFAIDEEDLCFAVQAVFVIISMVDKTGFIAKASSINSPVTIEVKKKR